MRVGRRVCSDPMVIWYNNNPKRKCWMINNRSQADSDNAKCVIKTQAGRVEDADPSVIPFEFSQADSDNAKCVIK